MGAKLRDFYTGATATVDSLRVGEFPYGRALRPPGSAFTDFKSLNLGGKWWQFFFSITETVNPHI